MSCPPSMFFSSVHITVIVVSIFTLYTAIFTLPNRFSSSTTLISRLLSSRPGWTFTGTGFIPSPPTLRPRPSWNPGGGSTVQWAQTWERWAHGLVGTYLHTLFSLFPSNANVGVLPRPESSRQFLGSIATHASVLLLVSLGFQCLVLASHLGRTVAHELGCGGGC